MTRRAALVCAALVAAALAATLAPGCSQVLGVADDPNPAVDTLCICKEVTSIVPDCAARLGERLSLATETVRADWLAAYTSKALDCTHCMNATRCYYLPPMCVRAHDSCTSNAQCCSFDPTHDTGCDDGGLCN